MVGGKSMFENIGEKIKNLAKTPTIKKKQTTTAQNKPKIFAHFTILFFCFISFTLHVCNRHSK